MISFVFIETLIGHLLFKPYEIATIKKQNVFLCYNPVDFLKFKSRGVLFDAYHV